MSERSESKKKLIFDCARKLFSERGYRDVTMSDVVESAGISRGGLYLYYTGTEDLFRDVIKEEMESHVYPDAGSGSPAEVLAVFLRNCKKRILKKSGSLERALYEYSFAGSGREEYLKKEFDEGVSFLTGVIEMGMETGEFTSSDPGGDALNIMYILEGMRIKAQTSGIRSADVDSEIMHMISRLASS
ncbi:MAG: TetR/AcrR family transcriptional regulator [Lachnospiraceae bacterium]|nr:TetR/AcrR family transcriptional regulator [Lachnospiraceae bacterium]